jgi:hypothetical protein
MSRPWLGGNLLYLLLRQNSFQQKSRLSPHLAIQSVKFPELMQ